MPENNVTPNSPAPAADPSLISTGEPAKIENPVDPAAPAAWAEFVPDPAKTQEENDAAKVEHDKTKPADEPVKPKDEFVPLADTDIKMPEGMEELPEAKTEFLGILNNRDLSPAQQAQALIDLQAKVMKDASERVSSLFTQQQEEWVEAIKKDPEFGGAKLSENLGQIGKLIDEFGGTEAAEIRQVMDLTGAGNNPQMIKFLTRVAKALGEGKPVSGAPGSQGIQTMEDLANSMYPSMKKS